MDGKSYNPCAGWCPEASINLLGPNDALLMSFYCGRFACDCGNAISFNQQFVHKARVFDQIEAFQGVGTAYNWKPC